jgi:hypothetical protein
MSLGFGYVKFYIISSGPQSRKEEQELNICKDSNIQFPPDSAFTMNLRHLFQMHRT